MRLLAVLAVATLVLSLGPYVPGFRYLIMLPGFSFFRAPSRWSVATALALALLAGKGFDRWGEWVRPGRSLRRLALIAICWVAVTLGLIELAIFCTGKPGWPAGRRRLPESLLRATVDRESRASRRCLRRRDDRRRTRASRPGYAQTILLRKIRE